MMKQARHMNAELSDSRCDVIDATLKVDTEW